MRSNLAWVRTPNGGSAPAVAIDRQTFAKVEKYLARDADVFRRNPTRCVIPEFDHVQEKPLVLQHINFGYPSLSEAVISVLSGWHFLRNAFGPKLYRANSTGLRLVATHGSPSKAYAAQ